MKFHKKRKVMAVIGLRATPEEQYIFNFLRKHMKRSSNSDVIRTLACKEYEKILNENTTVDKMQVQ